MSSKVPSHGWPLDKIERRLAELGDLKKATLPPAILLSTGALNPVHNGHVQLLHRAAEHLGAHFTILGAYLSPSHDQYLSGKFGTQISGFEPHYTKESCWTSATKRLEMCEAATSESTLVSPGYWESQNNDRWPDFPVVSSNCLATLSEALGLPELYVIYCCGHDHYKKCYLQNGLSRNGKKVGVCVMSRGGESTAAQGTTSGFRVVSEAKFVYAVDIEDADTSDNSSTMARKLLSKGADASALLHPGVLALHEEYRKGSDEKK